MNVDQDTKLLRMIKIVNLFAILAKPVRIKHLKVRMVDIINLFDNAVELANIRWPMKRMIKMPELPAL